MLSTFEIFKLFAFILFSILMYVSTITFIYGQHIFLEFTGYPECACRVSTHMSREVDNHTCIRDSLGMS